MHVPQIDAPLAVMSVSVVLLLAAIKIGRANAQDIKLENLRKESIIPTILDKEPTVALQVTYNSGVQVDYGNELTPTQVKDEPSFDYPINEGKLYTIALVDPDAPTRMPISTGQFLHFMVNNVPGKDIKAGNIMADYVGAGPPMGTGLHRYIFVLFEQPGRVKVAKRLGPSALMARRMFSMSKYAADNNLGEIIGINFFQAKYDDYVAKLYKRLMG